MKVLDLNVLLYAVNRDSAQHVRTRAYVESLFAGEETIAFPWSVTLGFIRIATNARLFQHPLTVDQALATVDSWFAQPSTIALNVADDHWRLLKDLLSEAGAGGNLTTDAHLAALAIENGAELVTTDSDFGRFRHLRLVNPLRAS